MNEYATSTPVRRQSSGTSAVVISALAVLAVSASIAWCLASAVVPATAQRMAATEPQGNLHAILAAQRRADAPPRLGRITFEHGRPTLVAGTASPGARATLRANGVFVGSATANADGDWSLAVERDLPLGDHRLEVGVEVPDGSAPVPSDIARVSTPLRVAGSLTVTFDSTESRISQVAESAGAPVIRMAQATTPPAAGQPADTLRDWVLRSEKSYQENIVKRLANPMPGGGSASPAATPAAVIGQASQPAVPSKPVPPDATTTSGSVVDGILDWLKRSNDTYQNAIVKRLADPYPTLETLEARNKAEATRRAADAKTGDDAMARARAELKAAQAQRDRELKAAEATPKKAPETPVVKPGPQADTAAKKAEDDRRIAEETLKRQADLQAAEEKRKADEAAARKAADDKRLADEAVTKRGAGQQADAKRVADEQAAEAKRKEEEAVARRTAEDKRLAEEAAARQAEIKRLADLQAAQAAEAKRKAEEAALRDAAARKTVEDKRLADEAAAKQAEAKRLADAQTAEAKRRADEAALRDAAARKSADERRLAEEVAAKRAVEQKAIDAQRRRAAELAEAASKEASSRIAGTPPPPPQPQPRATPSASPAAPAALPKTVAKTAAAPPSPPLTRRGPAIDTTTRSALGAGRPDKPSRRAEADAGESCRRAGRRIKPPGYYVVKSGDSLWEIAELHYGDGDRYAVLERANRKLDPDVIHPCQRVYVPAVKTRR